MDKEQERLIRKGAGEPLAALAQQGRVSHALWENHQEELAADGFTVEEGAQLLPLAEELSAKNAAAVDARDGAQDHTASEQQAQSNAKAIIRKLRNLAPMALRKKPVDGVTAASFNAGGSLGRSTPKMSKYLGDISIPAKKADAAFAPYFKGQNVSELVAAAKQALDSADSTQERAVASLPAQTQKLYEAKGRLLELVEDLNRVARTAFDGDARKIALFNKDILLRGRKSKKVETLDPA